MVTKKNKLKIEGQKILENFCEFCEMLINWRVLPLVKINIRISDTPCI
jgi:hypothetical protein